METILIILGALCILAGFIGSFLPIVPGTPVTYCGLLILQLTTQPFSATFLIVWALIVATIMILDNVIPAYGTKKFGGSPYGIWGSLLGSLCAGVNFPALACRAGLGLSLPAVEYEQIPYCVVGDLGAKRLWRAFQRGIPLRNSCLAYAVEDPLPDLVELGRLKWDWAKRFASEKMSKRKGGHSESPRRYGRSQKINGALREAHAEKVPRKP